MIHYNKIVGKLTTLYSNNLLKVEAAKIFTSDCADPPWISMKPFAIDKNQ